MGYRACWRVGSSFEADELIARPDHPTGLIARPQNDEALPRQLPEEGFTSHNVMGRAISLRPCLSRRSYCRLACTRQRHHGCYRARTRHMPRRHTHRMLGYPYFSTRPVTSEALVFEPGSGSITIQISNNGSGRSSRRTITNLDRTSIGPSTLPSTRPYLQTSPRLSTSSRQLFSGRISNHAFWHRRSISDLCPDRVGFV